MDHKKYLKLVPAGFPQLRLYGDTISSGSMPRNLLHPAPSGRHDATARECTSIPLEHLHLMSALFEHGQIPYLQPSSPLRRISYKPSIYMYVSSTEGVLSMANLGVSASQILASWEVNKPCRPRQKRQTLRWHWQALYKSRRHAL